jgi:hypothetical protein
VVVVPELVVEVSGTEVVVPPLVVVEAPVVVVDPPVVVVEVDVEHTLVPFFSAASKCCCVWAP